MKQKTFTAPSNQIIRVTGISILPNGSRHTVAYITEHNNRTGHLSSFLQSSAQPRI